MVFSAVDLTDAVLSECLLDRVTISDSELRGIRVSETRIALLNSPILAAGLSQWRDVFLTGSRIGSAELFESQWTGSHISGCKLGYVNFRGATLANVEVIDCTIDELDLAHASASRVAIRDCRIGTLNVSRASLKDVDLRSTTFDAIVGLEGLRGATIDDSQLTMLAPHLARSAGIVVE